MTQYRYTIIFHDRKIIADEGWVSFEAMWDTILEHIHRHDGSIVQDIMVSRYVRS